MYITISLNTLSFLSRPSPLWPVLIVWEEGGREGGSGKDNGKAWD